MIKTKPATQEYRNNFDAIFKKDTPMKRYTVPVDFSVMAKSAEDAEKQAFEFVIAALS